MVEDERLAAIGRPSAGGPNSRWLLREIEPAAPAHSITATARFPGKPDISAMRYALSALAARHATLRRSFPSNGGSTKWTARMAKACLRQDDARDLDGERFANGLEYAAHEPFDLARGPRLRVHLYRRAAQETVILVVAHHFIADVWLMTTLTRELEALYIERAEDMPAPSSEPAAAHPAATDPELVRLYRWVGGRRFSVHAAQNHGPGGRPVGARRRSGVTLRPAQGYQRRTKGYRKTHPTYSGAGHPGHVG